VRRLREDRGEVSLTALLVGMVVMGIVSGAILLSFETWLRTDVTAVARAESQGSARRSLATMARELRNLASPTPEKPESVDLATPFDLVFQTVDPVGPNAAQNATNVRRVRYCLDSAAPAKLWSQTQRWTTAVTPAVPSVSGCPASGWQSSRVVAQNVTNRMGANVPVFTANAASLDQISALHVDLLVDDRTSDDVAPVRLASGVFLRNQNRRPVAAFTATRTAAGIVLNGSASADPEGETLTYSWYSGATKIGSGVTFTYAVAPGTPRTISLKVTDPAGLVGDAPAQVIS
jgi:type II secretory pathway pseudopilin PulG